MSAQLEKYFLLSLCSVQKELTVVSSSGGLLLVLLSPSSLHCSLVRHKYLVECVFNR